MAFEPKNFEAILGTNGFSDKLLKNHFALYEGYVKNTNKLEETLSNLLRSGKTDTPEYAELKRRFVWEFNGMRLHELYFWNISKENSSLAKDSVLLEKIIEDFGALISWEKDFQSVGMMRGIGWAALCCDPVNKKLFNVWINEHNTGYPVGAVPLLIMDVFEHAYMTDYETRRADYVTSFFKAIDWKVVTNRFDNI